jgi:hypothetical protein
MHPPFQRAGITQVCLIKNGEFWMEQGFLGRSADQLVVHVLRNMLWNSFFAMDVYAEKIPF